MKNEGFKELFVEQLEDTLSSEQQIIILLPKLIKLSSLPELKEALTKNLRETENQLNRVRKIFSTLNVRPSEKTCEAMEGIIKEAEQLTSNKSKSPTLDAAIIAAVQKVEHYEIASYGSLCSFAKQLNFDSEVTDLLYESLDEETAANKKLTKIADGSFFSSGVNKEAAEQESETTTTGRDRYR
jgi:ferritin-like metal-binding protein YciE